MSKRPPVSRGPPVSWPCCESVDDGPPFKLLWDGFSPVKLVCASVKDPPVKALLLLLWNSVGTNAPVGGKASEHQAKMRKSIDGNA